MGTAGAVTGMIAGKVTAKFIGKGAIQFEAKALVKSNSEQSYQRIWWYCCQCSCRHCAGFCLPGVGTAVGAAVGGIISGITAGLTTIEKLLLMLEEAYSRNEFKQQILEAIENTRLEFEFSLYPDN